MPVLGPTLICIHVHVLYQALRARLAAEATASVGEEFFTVHNWANWAYIWLKVGCDPGRCGL